MARIGIKTMSWAFTHTGTGLVFNFTPAISSGIRIGDTVDLLSNSQYPHEVAIQCQAQATTSTPSISTGTTWSVRVGIAFKDQTGFTTSAAQEALLFTLADTAPPPNTTQTYNLGPSNIYTAPVKGRYMALYYRVLNGDFNGLGARWAGIFSQ